MLTATVTIAAMSVSTRSAQAGPNDPPKPAPAQPHIIKIGEGSVVVEDITRPGTYIITPRGKIIDVPAKPGGGGGRSGGSEGAPRGGGAPNCLFDGYGEGGC